MTRVRSCRRGALAPSWFSCKSGFEFEKLLKMNGCEKVDFLAKNSTFWGTFGKKSTFHVKSTSFMERGAWFRWKSGLLLLKVPVFMGARREAR